MNTNHPISELDAIDRRILAALQEDGRLTLVELAERVGLSASPCLRRMRRLEEDSFISGYRAALDRARIGLGLTVFMGIKVDGHRDENAAALGAAIQAMPEVVACHIVSGAADFLVEVVVPDLAHYERLLFGTFLRLPMVKDVQSQFVLRTVKPASPLPLEHLASETR